MSSNSIKNKINQIVYDGIIKSLEIIISCHDKNCSPRVQPGEKFPNNLAYIKKRSRDLERNIHIPFTLDVYLDVDNNNGISSLLIERWKIHYEVKKRESKEERASTVNKHIGIMMRTLYCYVRLLPSFQLSTKSKDCPISFKIHVSDLSTDEHDRFVANTSTYQLPVIPTPTGNLSMRLRYIDANDIKSIYDLSDRMYKLDALHAFRNTTNDTLHSDQQVSNKQPHSAKEALNTTSPEVYRGRRHSVSHEPIPIPHQQHSFSTGPTAPRANQYQQHQQQHQRAVTSLVTGTPPGLGSSGSYTGGLRSPTQPSTSLVEFPDSKQQQQQGGGRRDDDIPDMPNLTRHQSKSWTAETPLTALHQTPTQTRTLGHPFSGPSADPSQQGGPQYGLYQQQQHQPPQRRNSLERQSGGADLVTHLQGGGGALRPRSLSKGDRGSTSLSSARQHGRPPQHPDGASSLSSSQGFGTPPHYYNNGSTPSAPFYIQPSSSSPSSLLADPHHGSGVGGGGGGAGNDLVHYSPQSISASPPFHCPSTNLLSTSPSTTVLGGIGLGSTMQNMRDYLVSGGAQGGGGNRPRTTSGEKGYGITTNYSNKSGADSMGGTDLLLSLSELPISPFENALSLVQQGQGGGSGGGDHDERSVNTGTITEDKGNADTDAMFDFEDTDALDDEDEEDEETGEDMPFAWAQQSTAESYVFNKAGGISHMPDVSTDGSTLGGGGGGGFSSSGGGGGLSGSGMVNLEQSFIAQQCMAPPLLLSFRQTNDEERESQHYRQDMGGSINVAFQKLDQLKQFQQSYTNIKNPNANIS